MVAVEATALALAGLIISGAALRAARRAWRRRADQPPRAAPDAAPDDLAWVRRRKFGAGR